MPACAVNGSGTRRLRICYVGHSDAHFIPPYVEYFSSLGHEVHLVTLHSDDVPRAIMHHAIDKPFDPLRDKLTYFWAHFKVRRVIRRLAADIVHAHYLTSNAVMAALAGCRPLIVSARGSDVHGSLSSPFKRRLILFAMRRADLVNVVSKELEQRVRELGVPQHKILCLSQGIEVERFVVSRANRRPGPPRMICTRRLMPFFNGDRIVAALAALVDRGVAFEFTFAARGPQEESLRRQVAERGLGDRVHFLGGFEQAELPALLAEHDVYVSAAPWDGTSPALLEALASGLFPVVSDTAANREWLSGEGDSLFFDWRREEELLRQLSRACTDGELRAAPVALNRGRVAERADRRTNLGRLHETYLRLIEAETT